jgi:hypothetical protein
MVMGDGDCPVSDRFRQDSADSVVIDSGGDGYGAIVRELRRGNLNHAPLPPREWTVVLTWRNMESALPLMGYGHAWQGRTIAVSNGSMMASPVDVFDNRDARPLHLGRALEFGRVDLQQATISRTRATEATTSSAVIGEPSDEVRNALEHAVVATAVAAQRALTYAELLDQALAVLQETYSIAPEPEAAQASPLNQRQFKLRS